MEKDLIEYIVRAIVDSPESVRVDEVEEMGETHLKLEVREQDVGRVIGRNGRVAKALRTILNATNSERARFLALDIANR